MALLSQTWTLTRKNLLIALNRHTISTIIRAFLLPVAFTLFLSYARNLFVPPSRYGIGSPQPIRTLAEGIQAAESGKNIVAFVNNGMAGGDIDRVIDVVAASAPDARISRLNDQTELLDVCKSSLRGATGCYGAVVFESSPTEGSGGIWNYTLRADGSFGTTIFVDKNTNDVEVYLLPLQRAVDFAIASVNTTIDQSALPSTVYEYPYTSKSQAERETSIRINYQKVIINVMGIAFLISLVGVTYHLAGSIASERELGMSQLIEAMMPNLRRWQPQLARILSYHLAFDLMYLPGWIIMGIVLGQGVFAETSKGIIIIYHILVGLSLVSFTILGASLFKKAQLSGITLAIATLLLGVIAQVLGKLSSGAVIILSLLFVPCNYVFSIVFMARFEQEGLPANLTKSAPNSTWSVPGIAMWIFLIIQIVVYPLLGALIERSLYGTASKGRSVVSRNLDHTATSESSTFDTVQLQDFSKHYRPNWFRRQFSWLTNTSKSTVVAVNGLTLNAMKGQIFVLLGANGSGKSTTLDAIAGLNTVTSGTITVDGTGGLGIAPQKNVLWDELTVEEHIRIFSRLKSPGKPDTKDSRNALIEAVDLDRKISAKSKTLSGGQKRKLQLGMMFTGGSAVCCVDEVSSGLDPLSRRKIWDILLAERGTRTIILTTHFLDEADLLADRIAILSKGTLRAQGSSVELKERLGGGYRIHLPAGPDHKSPPMDGITSHTAFGQTTYVASTSTQAAKIIKHLESEKLTDYQLSGPTIEDVFLQLADEVRAESPNSIEQDLSSQDADVYETKKLPDNTVTPISGEAGPALELHSGRKLGFFSQAWVLFCKRATILRRNYLPYLAALLIPIIAAGLTTLFVSDSKPIGCSPDQQISLSDVDNLISQINYDLVMGPSQSVSDQRVATLFGPLLNNLPISIAALSQSIHKVDTFSDFNDYIVENYRNVTPGGFFLDDGTGQTTLAYKGNGPLFNGVFAQNIMNTMLTNISIATQYSIFDIPWAPSTGKSLELVVYFGLAMAASTGFFSLYPTIERTRNIRGLEYSNGVRSLPLWLAYVTFDFLIVLVSSALCVIIFASASSVWFQVGYLFPIFLLFGLASILLAYVVSLFAKSQLSAFAISAAGQALLFLAYLIGQLVTLTYAPVDKIDSYLSIVHFTISLITPMGSLVRGLFVSLNVFSTTCSGKELTPNPRGLQWYGGPILYLIIQIFVLFSILLWYDSGSIVAWYRRLRRQSTTTSEADIPAGDEFGEELDRVKSSNDGLRVLHLTKSFGRNTAVENLTFGIQRGEVFALLGPNGAGKSTTISLIRGDIQPSRNGGNVFVENVEINKRRADARSHLGVCPQYDGKMASPFHRYFSNIL